LGDIATKLPDEVAAHAYHRIDYEVVWVTLRDDVPRMDEAIGRARQSRG
jgi:uncharacterized protein with HEPN domain